ncbi:L-type lectin-domain containing receptor kinase S.4-like [Hibiscus syriacus]|uniref:RING-type E3 ubiquitin transferase n=1 Tax=Hibiscus syriacus TaxID=106335 RepID=A0A6A2Y0Z1_HIBSY|nr:L-type lectin-domain containing receptor kinase S.4-like [Hibiscus syriacus]
MAMTTSYWCYRCHRVIRFLNQDAVNCPDCHGGFVEEIGDNSEATRAVHVGSNRLTPAVNFINPTPGTAVLRRGRRNGGNRSPFNPVIVLRGGAVTSVSASPSSGSGGDSSVEQNGRGFELYYDDGAGSGLRPLPPSMSEFLLGSGFDRLIDQLSQMEIHNTGRNEQPPASKAAVEAMPTVEINETHINDELCCPVCKEQFEIEGSETGGGYSNSSDEVPVGLTIWRLPGGGFAVGRFSGGIRGGSGENRDFPVVYTEVDGGFSDGGLPRRVSWGNRGSRGRERRGFFRRTFSNLLGCFSGSNSSNSRMTSR